MAGGAGIEASGLARGWPLFLYAVFAALGLLLFRDALHGPFISDDIPYIVTNPYTTSLSLDNALAILDPRGPAKFSIVNYAPVHLLLHSMERHFFGPEVFAYHLVNVLVHALSSVLLVALLLVSRVPAMGALAGGALFAVHPANVEAVAWISQLKTSGCLALVLGALLAQRRHPALAPLLFGLALLLKPTAVFGLPMAGVFVWTRRGGPGGSARDWVWLGGWLLVLVLYAIPEFAAFRYATGVDVPAFADPWVHARTVAAIGARYLVMAATSYGVSAFHEPPPAFSPVDPWWLASLPAGALLAWRVFVTLRRRSEEAAYWVGAAASFVPISQCFPFLFPMGDRYLYLILPGLIGGVLLAGAEGRDRLVAVLESRGLYAPSAEVLGRVLLAGAAVLAVLFAVHSAERAGLWRGEQLLLADGARHYPDGGNANFLRTLRAIEIGDADAAIAALGAAVDRGYDRVRDLPRDPLLAPLRDKPGFRELMRKIATRRIQTGREREYSTPVWLRTMALAHQDLGEHEEAVKLLERAVRASGPFGPFRSVMISEVERARHLAKQARRAQADRSAGEHAPDRGTP